jgi:hypothetical protein
MNARMREVQRDMTARRRRKPGAGAPLMIPFDGLPSLEPDPNRPPSELSLEATGPSGEPAAWLDDYLWVDLLRAWGETPLAIRILPTPHALLHPVVLHQVNMLRRVAPRWRISAHCYVGDLAPEGHIAQAALSPYHEIHLLDQPAPHHATTAHALRMEDAVARLRRVQVANQRNTPILACARRAESAPGPASVARPATPRVAQTAVRLSAHPGHAPVTFARAKSQPDREAICLAWRPLGYIIVALLAAPRAARTVTRRSVATPVLLVTF